MKNSEVRNKYMGLMWNLIEQRPTTYTTMKISWSKGMMCDHIVVPEVVDYDGIRRYYLEGVVWRDDS